MRIHIENPLKWDPDPGGIKLPTKDKKKFINVLKCWMFSFEGWRLLFLLKV